jgi:branched-chain amino acid transport system permease protein
MLTALIARLLDWLRTAAGLMVLITIVLAVAATLDAGPYVLVNTIITGGMLALVSMGLALVFGVLLIPSFVHGEYFMIGGLVAFFVMQPLQELAPPGSAGLLPILVPFIGIIIAALAGALAGAVSEIVVFRPLRERNRTNWVMNCFLLTVGLNVLFQNGHQLIFGTEFKGIVKYFGGRPFNILDVFISKDRVIAFILAIVVIIGFGLFMKYTRIGKAIRAVSNDADGASMVGIDKAKIYVLTMALGCGLAAVAGGGLLFMYPSYPTAGLEPLYMAWFVVILVGLGNVLGALIGGFMVALFKVLTVQYIGAGWDFVVPSALIMLVLLIKPQGIFGSEVRSVLDE